MSSNLLPGSVCQIDTTLDQCSYSQQHTAQTANRAETALALSIGGPNKSRQHANLSQALSFMCGFAMMQMLH